MGFLRSIDKQKFSDFHGPCKQIVYSGLSFFNYEDLDLSEAQIERQICNYLSLRRYFFWKNTSSGYFDAAKKRFRKHSSPYVRNGTPDIILIHMGQFIGLEVKTSTGRQSDAQKSFQKDLESAGARYFLVRSIDQLQDILRSI